MSDTYRDVFYVKGGVQFADTEYELVGVVNIVTDDVAVLSSDIRFGQDSIEAVNVVDTFAATSQCTAFDSGLYAREKIGARGFANGSIIIRDKFYISSNYFDNLSYTFREFINSKSTAFADYVIRDYVHEVLTVQDSATATVIEAVSEKIGVSSSAFIVPKVAVVRDFLGARSSVFEESYVSLVSVERIGVKARAEVGVRSVLRETFKATSSVCVRLPLSVTVRDRFGVSSTALTDLSSNAFYRDQFGASANAFAKSSTSKTISDLFAATSRALPERNDPLSAWTTDLRSWGMSRYLNLPVREFVGVQYGFGPGGVYTGRGTVSTGRVETGYLLDRNAEAQAPVRQEKHLNYVYVYGASLGNLDLSVRAEDAVGHQQVFSYESARFSSTPSAVRIPTGRGIRSTWMSFSITGAPFRIEYIEAQYTPTRRRV